MSDTNTAAAEAHKAVESAIPIKPLIAKDETGKEIGRIMPVLDIVERGTMEGCVYPTIKVTKENLNDYVKVRGLDTVLAVLNARERLDAQASLDYVLDPENDWEEVEGMTDKEGKPREVWNYIVEKFVGVIDKFYETLLSGKVRGGVTIKDLKEEQESLLADMTKRLGDVVNIPVDRIKDYMLETNKLSMKYQDLSAQIAEIQKARKPRKTKAQKAAEQAAAKAAAQQAPAAQAAA